MALPLTVPPKQNVASPVDSPTVSRMRFHYADSDPYQFLPT